MNGTARWIELSAVFALLSGICIAGPAEDVARVLDDWHAAAAIPDGERYFGHFASDGVFLGTDDTERWTVDEFRAFAEPYFSKGRGWLYVPGARHVEFSADRSLAWIDEKLRNSSYGLLRGTGVLRRESGVWKIVHYSMSFTIPNEITTQAVAVIRTADDGPAPRRVTGDLFFAELKRLCAARFEGYSSYPEGPDATFAGKKLVAQVASCDENEIRIPFTVGEDRSRTWILARRPEGLSLKHDHRHEDGTPDEITMYGGLATRRGSRFVQSFAADDHTIRLIPEAATNVWTLSLDPEGGELSYDLDRHGKPRFKATLRRVED